MTPLVEVGKMTKRERLEDLGVVAEKLRCLLDYDLFSILEKNGCRRAKDAVEIFSELSEDKKYDLIHDLAYAIHEAQECIAECYSLAMWPDDDRIVSDEERYFPKK